MVVMVMMVVMGMGMMVVVGMGMVVVGMGMVVMRMVMRMSMMTSLCVLPRHGAEHCMWITISLDHPSSLGRRTCHYNLYLEARDQVEFFQSLPQVSCPRCLSAA